MVMPVCLCIIVKDCLIGRLNVVENLDNGLNDLDCFSDNDSVFDLRSRSRSIGRRVHERAARMNERSANE